MDRRLRHSRNPWVQLIHVYSADKWPKLVREKFWCSGLEYRDRAFIASFAVQNGIPSSMYMEALEYCNPNCTAQRSYQIFQLIEYLSGNTAEVHIRRARYYAFDLYHQEVLDLNGNRRGQNEFAYRDWVRRSGLAADYVSPCQGQRPPTSARSAPYQRRV